MDLGGVLLLVYVCINMIEFVREEEIKPEASLGLRGLRTMRFGLGTCWYPSLLGSRSLSAFSGSEEASGDLSSLDTSGNDMAKP
jgi:hypothetical protein